MGRSRHQAQFRDETSARATTSGKGVSPRPSIWGAASQLIVALPGQTGHFCAWKRLLED